MTADGLAVSVDSGQQVLLERDLLSGLRQDGTPNVSHAWARTVDGAQGGTWRQVHLLGTPALDRFTGYVGQSRGQAPTHTWNTRPEPDHPLNLLADDRSPGEAVLDALRRDEPKTLAAHDDPWLLDRRLGVERDEHAAVAASRPPDQRADLKRATDALARAADEHHWAAEGLVHHEDERARLGPLTRLRRGGRSDIARADEGVADAHRRLERAERSLHIARADVCRLQQAVAEQAAWDRSQAWRLARIAEIENTLAHHWADVALRAVRADDPLAFGADRLRCAHATFRDDLRRLTASLPPDRRDALARTEADLRHHEHNLRHAARQVTRTRAAAEEAGRRHWGRRDKTAIDQARARLDTAESNLARAGDAVARSRQRVTEEGRAVGEWSAAMRSTADERARLAAAIADITEALDIVRPERVAAATREPGNELWHTLGPPPTTRGGLAAWCGIAEVSKPGEITTPRPGYPGATRF